MGRKDKIKLTDQEKKWASNMQWYALNKLFWAGPTDERFFKEKALDGRYAIFSMRGDSELEYFDYVNCTDSLESAHLVGTWNLHTVYKIVDLEHLCVEFEARRPFNPDFGNLIEKINFDKEVKRYSELKKSLKPVLKCFKDLR